MLGGGGQARAGSWAPLACGLVTGQLYPLHAAISHLSSVAMARVPLGSYRNGRSAETRKPVERRPSRGRTSAFTCDDSEEYEQCQCTAVNIQLAILCVLLMHEKKIEPWNQACKSGSIAQYRAFKSGAASVLADITRQWCISKKTNPQPSLSKVEIPRRTEG